jgi:hypothetical protein
VEEDRTLSRAGKTTTCMAMEAMVLCRECRKFGCPAPFFPSFFRLVKSDLVAATVTLCGEGPRTNGRLRGRQGGYNSNATHTGAYDHLGSTATHGSTSWVRATRKLGPACS